MSDALLTRIAVALEKIAGSNVLDVVAAAMPSTEAKPVKPRGRPARGEETAAPVTTVAATPSATIEEEDPFATVTAPVVTTKTYTLDEVRAALVDAQKRLVAKFDSKEGAIRARAILKTVGGADTLVALTPDKFAAVVEAAIAAV